MATDELYFKGVNGPAGEYLLKPRTAGQVAESIREDVRAKNQLEKAEADLQAELRRVEAAHQAELDKVKAELERVKAELQARLEQEKAEAARQAQLRARHQRET